MKLKFGTVLLALTIIAISCTKSSGDCSTSTTKGALLVSGSPWKVDSFITGTIIYKPTQPCEADNTISFKSDGSVSVKDGALVCTPDAWPDTESGTWCLNADDIKGTINLGQGAFAVTVISITADKFTYQVDEGTVHATYYLGH